jgi:two-component system response regulator HydG
MKALIVDDDATLRLTVKTVLQSKGFQVLEAADGQIAVDIVQNVKDIGIVILDVNMPRMNGLDALVKIKEINPSVFCIVATAYSNMNDAIKSIRLGAYDYLQKPVESDKLLRLLANATEANNMVVEASFSSPQLQFDEGRTMIGSSGTLQRVFEVIHRLSKVDTSVLIRGESGTGKELVARALHFNSPRKNGPFVAVNCAAIPESLIESELFGHEKGSFTGADKKKIGRFQQADGGTIFLDEIGDISLSMQVKLLRVLQERVVQAVGSSLDTKIDVRIVTATHRPLEKMVQEHQFRSDLLFRLNVLPINLPPLRERKDDIPSLTNHLIKKFNKSHKRKIEGIEHEALVKLISFDWPGNIRELENTIERAFIMESTSFLTLSSFPDEITRLTTTGNSNLGHSNVQSVDGLPIPPAQQTVSLADHLNFPAMKEKFEREFILRALKQYKGRINQTAEATQMTKVTLLRKLEKFQIDPKEFYSL